jgi:hypothetical protein
MARGAPVQHAELRRLRLAQMINRLHGGAVVSLWDLGDLDGPAEDLIFAVAVDLPKRQASAAEIERQRMTWLKSHPQYGEFGLLVN